MVKLRQHNWRCSPPNGCLHCCALATSLMGFLYWAQYASKPYMLHVHNMLCKHLYATYCNQACPESCVDAQMCNMALAASRPRACRDNDANTKSATNSDMLSRLLICVPSCKEWGPRSMFQLTKQHWHIVSCTVVRG